MRRLVVTMLMTLALAGLHPTRGNAQAPAGVPAAAPPGAASAGGVVLPQPALQPVRPVRRLSVEEAVTLALEQNLDLRVERINPLIQDAFVAEARSVYAPELSTTLTGDDWDRPAGNIFDGGDVVTNRFVQDDVGVVQQVPWKGGQYSAGWTGRRSTTTNVFTSFNPLVESTLNLNYTQPLVRNFGIDVFRQQIAISRANRDISDIELRRIVVLTERTVRNAYWQLVFARSFLEVQRQSLALAEESLRNNRNPGRGGHHGPHRHRRGRERGGAEHRGGDSRRGGPRARRGPVADPGVRPAGHARFLVRSASSPATARCCRRARSTSTPPSAAPS